MFPYPDDLNPTRCHKFDHTCDDCMLPWSWRDYTEDPAYIEHEAQAAWFAYFLLLCYIDNKRLLMTK